ncbi:MAG: hypothetical protein J6T72_02280 [Alphaproteobacteria bacterium]|nr:hypothetical protein [Alphaproteobacteria bacterium]
MLRVVFYIFCFVALGASYAEAQFFADDARGQKSVFVEQSKVLSKELKNDLRNSVATQNKQQVSVASAVAKKGNVDNISPFDYSNIEVEKDNTSSKVIYPAVILDENNNRVYKEAIFLTMKNFDVYRSPSRQVRCSMRFSVLSTYKEKISNVSYKLQWPEISTNLSFDNVQPNIEYYMDYLLIGDGCYTMDKIPNIIVNRCRVKGKTQQQCASSVTWLTQSM